MTERRYNDEEVEAIFQTATDDRPLAEPQRLSANGFTLAQLQAIGREAGIAPDAVARAAVALDVRTGASQRTWLGLPIGVTRTVEFERKMSDEEWERFVVQLREVFHARGTTRGEGSLRQWTNGNLYVLLEPTKTGHRLRFGTYNGGARASITAGLVSIGATIATMVATAANGALVNAAPGVVLLGLVGLGLVANGAMRLPGWARLRGRQMEELAADAVTAPTPPTS